MLVSVFMLPSLLGSRNSSSRLSKQERLQGVNWVDVRQKKHVKSVSTSGWSKSHLPDAARPQEIEKGRPSCAFPETVLRCQVWGICPCHTLLKQNTEGQRERTSKSSLPMWWSWDTEATQWSILGFWQKSLLYSSVSAASGTHHSSKSLPGIPQLGNVELAQLCSE